MSLPTPDKFLEGLHRCKSWDTRKAYANQANRKWKKASQKERDRYLAQVRREYIIGLKIDMDMDNWIPASIIFKGVK